MIIASDTDPTIALSILSSSGLIGAPLVPTETAMKKSIIDATYPVRKYLEIEGVHDYRTQQQGPEHKVTKETYFVRPASLERTETSLYRPVTKEGDPRIWFYDLKSYARAYNLLILISGPNALYVVNCSDDAVMRSIQGGQNPLFEQLLISSDGLTVAAQELLEELKAIGRRGFIPSKRSGDTGIGFTLEKLLGIQANSSRAPDYKGVELKAGRQKSFNQSLFAKTPDWKLSALKSAKELLYKRGRHSQKKARLQLFHSLFVPKANSYDLQLEVDYNRGLLVQFCNVSGRREDDVLWELETLREALASKHRETFWVNGIVRSGATGEEFHYHEGTYTRGPNVEAFPLLLEAGEVFVDYTMWAPKPGGQDNKGFLFRMKKNRLEALFGTPRTFDLTQ